MTYELPDLPYEFDALEPHIDKETMHIHHSKHHQAYIDKLNAAIKGTDLEGKDINEVLKNLDAVPEDIRMAVRNHGGGHSNHSAFWLSLAPEGKCGQPSEALLQSMKDAFDGDEKNCAKAFTEAAMTRFGSGWAWLVVDKNKKLKIY